MFNETFLFPSPLYSVRIDPTSYNKKEIIDTVTKNYNIDKGRNAWDTHSNLHHSYNDWTNDRFNKIDTSSLLPIYNNIVSTFLEKQQYVKKIKYKWAVENVTAYNHTQFMREHDHLLENVLWTCVHYLSVPKGSSPLTFHNPLSFHTYNQHPGVRIQEDFVDRTKDMNSTYYPTFDYYLTEDDLIIFPAYLRHSVNTNPPLDTLRIAVVINICFMGFDTSET